MVRVTIVQVIYNNRDYIEPVFSAIFGQTYRDFNVVAVIAGNDDGSKELLMEKFPRVEIIDPGYNIGFAKGHNLVFEKYGTLTRPSSGSGHPLPEGEGDNEKASGFFQLVNPDLILEPTYVENILKVFDDPKVGAATGKLYQVDREEISNFKSDLGRDGFQISNEGLNTKGRMPGLLDSTGVTISKSGRARDRGQHEVDSGQYDNSVIVDAVSGAGAMYRRAALLATGYKPQAFPEYFDEDFHSYWEDVDLSWRMKNAGWKNVFVPSAVAYHGRGAGSSVGGYKDVAGFIRHHKQLPPEVRRLNYQNHIFMYIKNSPWLYPQFLIREFFMLGYILLFETATFKIIPQILRLLPKMWAKRKIIQFNINHGQE